MSRSELRVCLIEDDALMGEALCERFEMEGFEHDWHRCGKDALSALRRRRYAVTVSDIRLPDMSGEDVFMQLRREQEALPPFLFMTGYGAIDQAVRLLKLGAADYLAKPLDVEALVQRIRELGAAPDERPADECVLGVSAQMRRIDAVLVRLAASDGTVLVTGESGVGKERVARRLHDLGGPGAGGAPRPFVPVNCAAIPEALIESELFGHEKGAFTGAARERRGCFEQAQGGTLFLDEIGDMPLPMQAKLLRAIQERSFTRVGGERAVNVDLRLVCATHQDLRQMVEAGTFREDLYYRVNVVQLRVPPLRERRDDVLWLAQRFCAEQSAKRGAGAFKLTVAAERALLSHPWPGNIRELKNCMERACILAERSQIGAEGLLGDAPAPAPGPAADADTLIDYLDACERRFIEQVLASHGWRMRETAEALGISRKNLWEKLRKHSIAEPERRAPD